MHGCFCEVIERRKGFKVIIRWNRKEIERIKREDLRS